MKNVVLAGLKHSGKSTLGRLLADRYSLPFYDLDNLLEARDPLKRGWGAREIFRTLGKEVFQSWEAEAALGMKDKKAPWILALGGGTIQNPSALSHFAEGNLKIFLEEEEDVLLGRILAGGIPAFLDPADPKTSFHGIYVQRTALLKDWCTHSLSLSGAGIPQALESLITVLKENDHGW